MTHVLTFTPPPLKHFGQGLWLLEQWFDPVFKGLENIDSTKPALYVGNHTIYGAFDTPLMLLGLYRDKGLFLRSLGDHFHFSIPLWRQIFLKGGCVAGTPQNCQQLMQAKEHIIVFPGGAREVMKNKGEAYQLLWKERTGFARMAMQNGYDIIPFASVGADEIYDIKYDAHDFYQSSIGKVLAKTGIKEKYLRGGDTFLPIATGLGLLPRPEKFYFSFGERISTRDFQTQCDNKELQWQVREQVEQSIYALIDDLLEQREQEQANWPTWRKKLIKRP